MKLLEYLTSSKKRNWGEAFLWLLWMVVGVLLPLILKFLFLKTKGEDFSMKMYTIDGELIIYSVSFFVSGAYLVFKKHKKETLPCSPFLGFLIFIGAVLSVGMYICITAIKLSGEGKFINYEFVQQMSLCIFPFACILSYFIVVFDNIRLDPMAIVNESFESINSNFDNLGESE